MSHVANFLRIQILVAALGTASLSAQQQDAPAVDLGQMLQALRAIREQQVVQTKALKQKALQDVQAAAASPAAAANAWEEAVRAVQFDGAPREGSQFKEWRDRDGDALKEREAANAAQLHFKWMALTLQRSLGVPVKDLLPQIIAFTKEVAADQAVIESFQDGIKRDKELAASGRHGRDRKSNDDAVKRVHDQIIRTGVNGSVAAQALKISEMLAVDKWEMGAGNVDGIFGRIILPELRAQRDPRILDYWDMKLKRETENAAKSKLAFDSEKFTQVRRPELLWNRANDVLGLGLRNRAIGEMFALIKTYPTHPASGEWMRQLEAVLAPPTAGASAAAEGEAAPLSAPPAAK